MGWWGSNSATTKSERISELVDETTWNNEKSSSEVIAKASVNGGAWTLQQVTNKATNKAIAYLVFNKIHLSEGQYMVKSMTTDECPYYFNCSKRMVDKWLKINQGRELSEYAQKWYSNWLNVRISNKLINALKLDDIVILGSSNEIIFKYWYNKSKTQFVGVNDAKKTFRYKVERITGVK
jgi:hypothetical protein